MEQVCPLRHASCPGRLAYASSMPALRTRWYARRLHRSLFSNDNLLAYTNSTSVGPAEKGLSWTQAGRRQRAARKASTSTVVPPWSRSSREAAASRTKWLEDVKAKPTKVLLAELLAPQHVPPQRLPVLLTLLEGREDLREALLQGVGKATEEGEELDLPAVVAAVAHSEPLLQLLPGGRLHALLLRMLAEHAPRLPTHDILEAARLLAAWPPPLGGAVAGPTAAAIAAILIGRARELEPRSTAATLQPMQPMSAARPTAAAEPEGLQKAAAMLVEGLATLCPWLEFHSTTATLSSTGVEEDAAVWEVGGGRVLRRQQLLDARDWVSTEVDAEADRQEEAGRTMLAAQEVVAVLMRRVCGGTLGSQAAATAAVAGPAVLHSLVTAAVEYGVAVPADVARAAISAATEVSATAPASRPFSAAVSRGASSQPDAAMQLAAQLVTQTCSCRPHWGGSSSSGENREAATAGRTPGQVPVSLSDEDVRSLVASHLRPHLGAEQHTAFLRTLRSRLQQQQKGTGPVQQQRRRLFIGLLQALGGAAAGLGAAALALSLECVEVVVEVMPATGQLGARGFSADGEAVGEERDMIVLGNALGRHFEAAATFAPASSLRAVAQQSSQDVSTAEDLYRVAAAATRLQDCWRRNGCRGEAAEVTACDAAAAAILAAVATTPLDSASIEPIVLLLSASLHTVSSHGSPRTVSATQSTALPSELVGMLLERFAEAVVAGEKSGPATGRVGGGSSQATARQQWQPPALSSLSFKQATDVLAWVAAAAEAATDTSPSSSAAAVLATPQLSPRRLAALCAAAQVAYRALLPAVRHLDVAAATSLLHLLGRCERAGVGGASHRPLLWALHERLCVFASSPYQLPPYIALDILRGCAALRWRPAVLLRELVTPLLRWLRPAEVGGTVAMASASTFAADGDVSSAVAENGQGRQGRGQDVEPQAWGWLWTAAEVQQALVLLAMLGYRSRLAAACAKMGIRALLLCGEIGVPATGSGDSGRGGRPVEAVAGNLATLLWVCVGLRYQGAVVLRPLMQQLLQLPASQVPVRVAAQALWAAARLGVVGERLVRWALACCQGAPGKVAAAPPQSVAILCWALAKLGVGVPQTFLPTVTSVVLAQLPCFKPKELATILFILATWGARLDNGSTGNTATAASAVQHVVATCGSYDGPALCTMAWALQRLLTSNTAQDLSRPTSITSGPTPDEALPESQHGTDTIRINSVATATSNPLTVEALAAMEEHLLTIWMQVRSDGGSQGRHGPRVGVGRPAISDHHLLRFFTACRELGYRPDRLLTAYTVPLRRRLDALCAVRDGEFAASAEPPVAMVQARTIWAVTRILSTYDVRDDAALLGTLEAAAMRLGNRMRPSHLAGLVNGLAVLGYYPARWVERGLLRRMGLALRAASVKETSLILEAVAAWRPHMAAWAVKAEVEVQVVGRDADGSTAETLVTASRGGRQGGTSLTRGGVGPAGASHVRSERAATKEKGGQGDTTAGGDVDVRGKAAWKRVPQRRIPEHLRPRAPTAVRVDFLRRVALARLNTLLAPPLPAEQQQQISSLAPPPPSSVSLPACPSAAEADRTESGSTLAVAATSGGVSTGVPQPAAAVASGLVSKPASGAGAGGRTAAATSALPLQDATRLLTALATLRWRAEAPVMAALVCTASRVTVERHHGLKELTTLLWAVAALRYDNPELLKDLQAALLGLPHQRSVAAEPSLLEPGATIAGKLPAPAEGPGGDAVSFPKPTTAATAAMPVALDASVAGDDIDPEVAPAVSPAPVEIFVELAPAAPAPAPALVPAATTDASTHQSGDARGPECDTMGLASAGSGGDQGSSCGAQTSVGDAGSPDGAVSAIEQNEQNKAEAHGALAPEATAIGDGDDAKLPVVGARTSASSISTSAPVPTLPVPTTVIGSSTTVHLLSRPAKPPQLAAASPSAAAGMSTASSRFESAATSAAAAKARHHEEHLLGSMGQSHLPSEPWAPVDIFKTLWACAKMNRHPGPHILAAAEHSWVQYTAVEPLSYEAAPVAASVPESQLPIHTLTGLLWALAVFRSHNSSFAQLLASQLAARVRDGDRGAHMRGEFGKQALQVAACLLAAQADRCDSPLNAALPPETRGRLLGAWRARVAMRVARPVSSYLADMVFALRKMGLVAAANVATPDSCVVVDVAVALMPPRLGPQQQPPGAAPSGPPPRLLALELVGRHNTASNSTRLVGEAVIKFRLLQARGYLVVPIPCSEWDRIGHQDMWAKMVYLRARIERRTSHVIRGPGLQGAGSVSRPDGVTFVLPPTVTIID